MKKANGFTAYNLGALGQVFTTDQRQEVFFQEDF